MYYLEDHSLMINEPKEVNSGTPQGVFLKRQMVLKQDGSNTPLLPTDFRVGLDVGILGRSIRIFDADQYTREFFDVRRIFKFHNCFLIEHWSASARRSIIASRQLCKAANQGSSQEGHRDEGVLGKSSRRRKSYLVKAVLR